MIYMVVQYLSTLFLFYYICKYFDSFFKIFQKQPKYLLNRTIYFWEFVFSYNVFRYIHGNQYFHLYIWMDMNIIKLILFIYLFILVERRVIYVCIYIFNCVSGGFSGGLRGRSVEEVTSIWEYGFCGARQNPYSILSCNFLPLWMGGVLGCLFAVVLKNIHF